MTPIVSTSATAALIPLTAPELARSLVVSTATARRLIASGKVVARATDLLCRPLYDAAEIEQIRRARWAKTRARFAAAPAAVRRQLAEDLSANIAQ